MLLFLPSGCKRAPRTWTLEKDGLKVLHVQPKVKPGQGEIPLEIRVEGPLPVPPKVAWIPKGGRAVSSTAMEPLGTPGKAQARYGAKLPYLGPGKTIRYHFLLEGPKGGVLRLPREGEFEVTCKGGVSLPLLLAHIGAMFLGLLLLILVAWKCLAFLFRGKPLLSASRMVKLATFFIFLGGLPLGMIVEKKVFGTWWEGWPFGRDVTDTKTGVILVLWLVLSFLAPKEEKSRARTWAWVVLASLVFTIALYAIPHENLKF